MSFITYIDESNLVVGSLYLLTNPVTFGKQKNADNVTLAQESILLYLGQEINPFIFTEEKFPVVYSFLYKDVKLFRELIKPHWFKKIHDWNL